MRLPRLYPILDTATLDRNGIALTDAATTLLDTGVQILQLRHKGHFSRGIFEQAEQIAEACRRAGALFVINDRADIAALLDAALHLGQDDLSPADARRVLGPDRIIGFSTHNEAQFRAALAEPIDYLALGPIFATASKSNPDPAVGTAELRRLRPLTSKPVVAIGGITLETAPAVYTAGADSIAIISALFPDPRSSAFIGGHHSPLESPATINPSTTTQPSRDREGAVLSALRQLAIAWLRL
jgi:thiamine-phosphate pyrophosphorylase